MSEAEPETECYRNILCGSGHNDGVFLCTFIFFFLAAQGGGGGLNPLNPPPLDPPLTLLYNNRVEPKSIVYRIPDAYKDNDVE